MEEFESPTAYLEERLGDSALSVSVPELTRSNLLKIADTLTGIYQQAYPEKPLPKSSSLRSFAEALLSQQERSANGVIPRRFIRAFLEHLDVESIGATV